MGYLYFMTLARTEEVGGCFQKRKQREKLIIYLIIYLLIIYLNKLFMINSQRYIGSMQFLRSYKMTKIWTRTPSLLVRTCSISITPPPSPLYKCSKLYINHSPSPNYHYHHYPPVTKQQLNHVILQINKHLLQSAPINAKKNYSPNMNAPSVPMNTEGVYH